MTTLPMDDIVNVIINLSPRSAIRNGFNLSMIIADSDVLGTARRVEVYSSLEAMKDDGFTDVMPEYKAAQVYLGQTSRPGRVAIGYWDSANETLASAIAACRAANAEWYGVVPIGGVQAGTFAPPTIEMIKEAATFIDSTTPLSVMFVAINITGMLELKAANYHRTLGVVTGNMDIPLGILGYAMGANTGLINSAFTLMFKRLAGVPVDSFTDGALSDIHMANGNAYLNRGATYDLFERGTMADGTWFDEIINLDMLAHDIQRSIFDLFMRTPKIPYTEGGVSQIINSFIPDLEKTVRTRFVAPGIWTAEGFLTLSQGDALEKGYVVLSEAVSDQTVSNRENRIAPPIYIALKLAGAIHHVIITVNVNR